MLEKRTYISSFSSDVESGQITLTEEIEIFEDGISLGKLRPRVRTVDIDPVVNYDWIPDYANYEVGDIVRHLESKWVCLTADTQEEPSDTAINWERIPEVSTRQLFFDSVRKVTEEVTKQYFNAGELTAEELSEAQSLYPRWRVGVRFATGDIVSYSGALYRCVQGHTPQSNWTPDATPALWVSAVPEGVVPEWTQPTGAHDAYNIGDRVMFEGSMYESLINGNTFSPTAYPAGWQLVA